MARSFNGNSQYLLYNALVRSTDPVTMAAWCYPLQNNATKAALSMCRSGGSTGRYTIGVLNTGKGYAQKQRDTAGGDDGGVVTANSYSANAWNHIVGVFESTTQRYAYCNGDVANRGVNTGNVDNPTATNAAVGGEFLSGVINTSTDFNGYIAHAAIWGVALSTAEVTALYNSGIGADPRSVRPDALVAYWPLLNNDGDQDYWGNFHLTASGSPTYAQHPPVLMRSRPKYVVIGAASGAPTISSVTITGTRTVSNTLTANVVTNPGTVDSIAYQWEIADDGSGTNAADLSGEISQTLALTYADFASRLDANGEAYVRVGAIATVGAESSAESFSDWVRVTAGGSGVVRPIGQSVYISV